MQYKVQHTIIQFSEYSHFHHFYNPNSVIYTINLFYAFKNAGEMLEQPIKKSCLSAFFYDRKLENKYFGVLFLYENSLQHFGD